MSNNHEWILWCSFWFHDRRLMVLGRSYFLEIRLFFLVMLVFSTPIWFSNVFFLLLLLRRVMLKRVYNQSFSWRIIVYSTNQGLEEMVLSRFFMLSISSLNLWIYTLVLSYSRYIIKNNLLVLFLIGILILK